MNIPETYDYLVRARRDLWTTLEAVPDEVLSRPLLDGERFHCVKDLVFHIADVEDGWLHFTIIGDQQPVQQRIPALRDVANGPIFAGFALETLLDYWGQVEQSTLAYLAALSEAELRRVVTDEGQRFTVDGLLWHVMLHEIRHTAQIAALLRTQGIKPPSLDLLFYLPPA
ncbi:DinB family protein [Deinococcus sp.]|uniref:DinB family protein n=1 Tax=Deinococcus sp. TaxID=47478 RepID=UPI0025DD9F58|nr:DinB family protein [Deinococcus sp.]